MKVEHICLLLTFTSIATAYNQVVLTEWQTNLTVQGSIASCALDYLGSKLMIASGNTLTILNRVRDKYFNNLEQITVSENVLEAKFNCLAQNIAFVSTSNTKLYLLAQQADGYDPSQTFELGQKPTSLVWGFNCVILAIGLNNGSISVFTLNETTRKYSWSQVINTTHSAIAKMISVTSRLVSCGLNDSVVNVYFYNLTTKTFTLNQSLNEAGSGSCTSLDLSVMQDRIVVGRSTGNVQIFKANYSMFYSLEFNVIKAHLAPVRFVKLTFDQSNLLTAGDDGKVSLWTEANNFTVGSTRPFNATSVQWSYNYREFVLADNNSNVVVFRIVATNCATKSVDPGDPSHCTCPAGQVWLSGNCSVLNCSSVPDSDGGTNSTTNVTCSCIQKTQWYSYVRQCILTCIAKDFPNSNGTSYELNSCFCNDGSTWNYSLKSCVVNCSLIAGTIRTVNQTACSCALGFDWDATKTLCVINCTNKDNSSGKSLNSTFCKCNSGYVWNTTTSACSRQRTINCSGVAHSNGSNIDAVSCHCSPGHLWNKAEWACFVDCTTVANAKGSSKEGTCDCFDNLTYIPSQRICTTAVDCSKVPNSPGTNRDANTCICDHGYSYSNRTINRNGGLCHKDCSRYARVVNRRNPDQLLCSCGWGFVWNSNIPGCVVNCEDMPYSTGMDDETKCSCQRGYRWDAKEGQCTKQASSVSKAVGLAIGIPLGLVALCGIAAIVWCACKAKASEAEQPAPSLPGYGAPISTTRTIPELKQATGSTDEHITGRFKADQVVQQRGSLASQEVITEEDMIPKATQGS